MPASPSLSCLVALAVLVLSTVDGEAQEKRSHVHIGHVATAFRGTPEGMGLLPTARAEAEVAAQHASLAARSPDDLEAMQRHAAHVLHALDPSLVEGGPGEGYGLIPATQGVIQHIQAAAGAGASDNVHTHSAHVARAARNALARAQRMRELGQEILAAESAEDAAPLVDELATLATRVTEGVDANGDGRIGWQEGEGGLATAQTHLEIMMRGEGLS